MLLELHKGRAFNRCPPQWCDSAAPLEGNKLRDKMVEFATVGIQKLGYKASAVIQECLRGFELFDRGINCEPVVLSQFRSRVLQPILELEVVI